MMDPGRVEFHNQNGESLPGGDGGDPFLLPWVI